MNTEPNNRTDYKSIAEQLKDEGLRLAGNTEAGWFVLVTDERNQPKKVWATDIEKG